MLLALAALCASVSAEDKNLFNGKDLTGWKGLDFWSVEDGAITGRTTKEKPTKGNTFLVWEGEVADFELTFQYKIVGGNSGVQYRSKLVDEKGFVIAGYQGDFEAGKTYSGILYEEKGRGILAKRGEKVVVKEGADAKKPLLPTYPKLAGQNAAYAEQQMKDIKSGARNNGQTAAMKGVMHLVNDEEIKAIADYLSKLK